jgi:hypothetical protein
MFPPVYRIWHNRIQCIACPVLELDSHAGQNHHSNRGYHVSTKLHGPRANWVQTRDPAWRSGERLTARPLLPLLLFIDVTLIAVHVWLWSRGQLSGEFNIELDASIPEWFNYLNG